MTVEIPFATQDLTYPAENTRRALFFPFQSGGVKNSGCAVTAPGGMQISVATGEMLIAGTTAATQGFYYVRVSASVTLSIAAASSSNPRIDSACGTVVDTNYAGSGASTALVQVITGTPAGSPVAPSLPASSQGLGNVLVPESASSISSGDLTDERVSPALAVKSAVAVRTVTVSPSGSTYTPDTDTTDLALISAPASNFTIANPTGTPSDGQKLLIRIDSGSTGYAPTWGTAYLNSGIAVLPSAAFTASLNFTFGFVYDLARAAWVLLAADTLGY